MKSPTKKQAAPIGAPTSALAAKSLSRAIDAIIGTLGLSPDVPGDAEARSLLRAQANRCMFEMTKSLAKELSDPDELSALVYLKSDLALKLSSVYVALAHFPPGLGTNSSPEVNAAFVLGAHLAALGHMFEKAFNDKKERIRQTWGLVADGIDQSIRSDRGKERGKLSGKTRRERGQARDVEDRQRLIVMCQHGQDPEDALGDLMGERGLTDRAALKKRIGWRELKPKLKGKQK